MTMIDDQPTTEIDTPAVTAGSSIRDRIRARREELLKEHFKDMDVPGYGGDVVIRFEPLDGGQIERVALAATKNQAGTRAEQAATDTLIAACEGIYLRDPSHPQANAEGLVNIAVAYEIGTSNAPVRFGDPRLAEALEFDHDPDPNLAPRAAARAVFGRKPAAPIIAMNAKLSRWMNDVTSDADEGLLGE